MDGLQKLRIIPEFMVETQQPFTWNPVEMDLLMRSSLTGASVSLGGKNNNSENSKLDFCGVRWQNFHYSDDCWALLLPSLLSKLTHSVYSSHVFLVIANSSFLITLLCFRIDLAYSQFPWPCSIVLHPLSFCFYGPYLPIKSYFLEKQP